MKTKEEKQRSSLQNNSLHLYCTEMAAMLNDSGISVSVVYENIEADHTMENVKQLFRTFAIAKYGKKSTTELTTDEMTKVYEEVNRHYSKFGVHLPWPSQESLINYE